MKIKPLVSVCMITYGHEKFIEESINSILMQETDFDVELILANDCSPDDTDMVVSKIIKNHPKGFLIKYTHHKHNLGMMRNFVWALEQCEGKYIAMCEGDDYWTDPLKLQKQVDFLEANKDYSICWTKYLVKSGEDYSNEFDLPSWAAPIGHSNDVTFDLDTIFTPYCTYTLTSMFRQQELDFKLLNKLEYSKDNTIYAFCLAKGKGMLLNFYSAVYRKHTGSIYSGASRFKQNIDSYRNIKEIIEKIPNCNNSNFSQLRNFHLVESLKLHPNQLSKGYVNLLFDSLKFLGIKPTMSLLKKRYYSYQK